ncbi:hypothetical protein KPL78_19325 [Roseomonas sp. HJA6]|uniref:Uncharacterized protein n=1 Tax=Roseomonas alba TaxID=2846776 RepID=A0ABS7ACK0_9PROT|nr:hypothetical protein [Neoroseomonas alba]MBW6400021.1 hypothetical protein [Neoroseomonas alba]
MPADRLTAETARVGQKVTNTIGSDTLPLGDYTIARVTGAGIVLVEEPEWVWFPSRFIPADPDPAPSWATEDLRAALVEWTRIAIAEGVGQQRTARWRIATVALFDAIEASGLLPTPPSTTAREATLDCRWWQ